MKRSFLLAGVLASLLAAPEARAQTGTARGKVLDEQGSAVAEARVDIEFQGGVSRKYDVKTNKKGEFTQVGLHPGVYRFTVTKDGYQGSFVEAKISLGEPTYLPDVKLMSKAAAAKGGGADKELQELQASVDQAIAATTAGRLDEAEAIYKEAIAKRSDVAPLHYNLGLVYTRKKDIAAAEAALAKAIELKPEYSDAHVALSNVYLVSNQMAKAAEASAKAAADHPDDAKLQFQLGYVYFNTSKHEEAAAALKKAAQLDPGNPEPHFYLGSIAIGQAKVDECATELEKYLSMSPQNPQNVGVAQQLLAACKPKK